MFIMPIGLNNIGWKMYMVNASWDIVILGLIVSLLPTPYFSLADIKCGLLGGDKGQNSRRDRCDI